jgi:CelD/BcsL family acetyltransferase involved in cellulose biosynthesis
MMDPNSRISEGVLFTQGEEESREIRVVETTEELSPLKAFWKKATRNSESPFSSWDWNQAWWKHLSPNEGRPRFLVSEAPSSEPECIFPLVESQGKLDLAGADWCDFQDAIVTGERELNRGIDALLEWIQGR